MSATADVNDELSNGGPLLRWERRLGIFKSGRQVAAKRTVLAILIGWLPLTVLAAAQLLISGDEAALVSLGVFVMVAFAVQHWLFPKKLQREDADLKVVVILECGGRAKRRHRFGWLRSLTQRNNN